MPSLSGRHAGHDQLESVVKRYYAPLMSFFRKRTENSADVQDLVQQVFLRLSRHPHVGALDNPDGYIFQTASNALRDHHRRSVARNRVFATVLAEQGSAVAAQFQTELSPDRILQGRQSIALIDIALRQLSQRTRDIFMLRCVEGLKREEIAGLHGISVRAVEKHYAKAMTHVDGALGGDWRASHERCKGLRKRIRGAAA